MQLTVLGSGVCIMYPDRKGPAYLLEADNQLVLLDCGWGFGPNLLQTSHSLSSIDHICISHPHADHMGSLMNILQSMAVESDFFPEKKRTKPLHLHGYKGFKEDYEKLRNIMFPERMETYEIKIYEYANNENTFGTLNIKGTEVKHNPHLFHSSAFRIEHNGKSLVYSGDTSYDENLIKLSKDADFALYEASSPPSQYRKVGPLPNHLSPFEAGKMAHRAEVKKLGLIHIYFEKTSEKEMETEVRQNFSGELLFLKDLDQFSL
jgi:ribonuclease BN (tRNA processing enzyme)